MRRKVLFAVLLFGLLTVLFSLPAPFARAEGFLEKEVENEKNIKTSSWFERQLAGLVTSAAGQFYEWMDAWGLKDPYELITADNPSSPANHLGLNSPVVQQAKEVVFTKFYRSAAFPIAALLIILAGFQFAIATNDEARSRAKQMILALLTFFAVLFAVDVIFQFLVDVEIASVNLMKKAISGWEGEKFRALLFGDEPVESMKAIRSLGLAVVALLFVFFMLRMNYVYIVRMISLVLLVTILPIAAALSVWPRFRASLSMLFREFFAQLFMPIGHAAVLLAMYFVVGGPNGNAFFIIPFVFGMGAVERIVREVFGVDTGIGASLGMGALSAIGGSIAIARGVGMRGSRGRSGPEKIEPRKSDPMPPTPPRNEPRTSVPGPSTSGPSPQTSPRSRAPSSGGSSGTAPQSDATVGSSYGGSSSSVPQSGATVSGSSGKSSSLSGEFGTSSVSSSGSERSYSLRQNPYARPVSKNAKVYTSGPGKTYGARKDTVGPMTTFDPKQPIPLEPYTPNMYSTPSSVQKIGRAVQTGARIAARATGKGLQVTARTVGRTAPGLIKGTARLAAGVTAGAAMYALSGNAEAAGMTAYAAGSAAGKAAGAALGATGKAGGALVKGGKRLDEWVEKKRIDEETAKRMKAGRIATARFRETLRGGNFPGTRTV